MDESKDCREVFEAFIQSYKLLSLISDAIYNNQRYAYNTNFVVIELISPWQDQYNIMLKQLRQTDKYFLINDKYYVIEYPFVDYIEAERAFENVRTNVFGDNIRYKYIITSLTDNFDLNTADLVKKMVKGICSAEIQNN